MKLKSSSFEDLFSMNTTYSMNTSYGMNDYERCWPVVPRIHMDSKEFAYSGTKIETTATFQPVFYRPWSRNEVVWGLRSA